MACTRLLRGRVPFLCFHSPYFVEQVELQTPCFRSELLRPFFTFFYELFLPSSFTFSFFSIRAGGRQKSLLQLQRKSCLRIVEVARVYGDKIGSDRENVYTSRALRSDPTLYWLGRWWCHCHCLFSFGRCDRCTWRRCRFKTKYAQLPLRVRWNVLIDRVVRPEADMLSPAEHDTLLHGIAAERAHVRVRAVEQPACRLCGFAGCT